MPIIREIRDHASPIKARLPELTIPRRFRWAEVVRTLSPTVFVLTGARHAVLKARAMVLTACSASALSGVVSGLS